MRFKGQHYRPGPCRSCPLDYLAQDVLVSKMHPIEIAHADDGWAEIKRDLVERAEGPHAISNSSFNPSWASRTCPGRLRLVSSWGRSWEMCVKNARCGFSSSTSLSELATVEWVG